MTDEISLTDLLELLDLELEGGPENDGSLTAFSGRVQSEPSDRVFGGLLLAQALVAAGRTAPSSHQPLAIQADFLHGVPTDRSLRWEVERLGEAKSMSARRATLRGTDGSELFTAVSRWGTVRDDLPSYDAVVPLDVVQPEALRDLDDRFGQTDVPTWWRMRRPVLFCHVDSPPYTRPALPVRNHQTVWVRARGQMPTDATLRAALLAYVTDMSIVEPAFAVVGSTRHGSSSRLLSLSHSLIFHAPSDLSSWHQFDTRCRTLAQGRAVGNGEVFDRAGRHIASATQLALVKFT